MYRYTCTYSSHLHRLQFVLHRCSIATLQYIIAISFRTTSTLQLHLARMSALVVVGLAALAAADVSSRDTWTGLVTSQVSWNSYCSSPLFTETETVATLLSDGDFCRTVTVDTASAASAPRAAVFYRTTVACAAPDGSGLLGIFSSSRNCTSAACEECSDTPLFVTRHSWTDWKDKVAYDTCHQQDLIVSEGVPTQAIVQYSKWGGADADSYVGFITANTCISDGLAWTGSVTSTLFEDDACTTSGVNEEKTTLWLMGDGAFCSTATTLQATVYHEEYVSCSAPDGSQDRPGVCVIACLSGASQPPPQRERTYAPCPRTTVAMRAPVASWLATRSPSLRFSAAERKCRGVCRARRRLASTCVFQLRTFFF